LNTSTLLCSKRTWLKFKALVFIAIFIEENILNASER